MLYIAKKILTGNQLDGVEDTSTQKAKKKSDTQLLMLIELTDGIVTSRIKVNYGISGFSLIKPVIVEGVRNFVIKLDQSITDLFTIDEFIAQTLNDVVLKLNDVLIYKNIYKITPAKCFRDKVEAQSAEQMKTVIAEITDENKKFYTQKMFDSFVGKTEVTSIEFIPFEIEMKCEESGIDGETKNRSFYFAVFMMNKRITIYALSNIFSHSQEIPIPSKLSLFQSIQSSLTKIIVKTYGSLILLENDSSVPENAFDTTVAIKSIEKLQAAGIVGEPSKDDKTQLMVFEKDYYGYILKVFTNQPAPGKDYFISILTFKKLSDDKLAAVNERTSYFPQNSQYEISVIINSFLEQNIEEFLQIAYSSLVTSKRPVDKEGKPITNLDELLKFRELIKSRIWNRMIHSFVGLYEDATAQDKVPIWSSGDQSISTQAKKIKLDKITIENSGDESEYYKLVTKDMTLQNAKENNGQSTQYTLNTKMVIQTTVTIAYASSKTG